MGEMLKIVLEGQIKQNQMHEILTGQKPSLTESQGQGLSTGMKP